MAIKPHFRFASPDDADLIHRYICELAAHENEPDAVECTPASLRVQLGSERPPFECVMVELPDEADEAVAIALFFHNYSTWRGRAGLYLEDLYVTPAYRGRGLGKRILAHLAQVAVERDCPRVEWVVLNELRDSVAFYESIGARPQSDWTLFRLTGDALQQMAAGGASS